MRITELHLRNIASIVSADIDFTKDICDRVTGDPASVFLIGGDTGAGKSVILDGISMALYKMTPRMDSVANKRSNTFRTAEGEAVGINSIEQYTRLGINPKEECYSEVAFEGNDGVQYRARLELGMYMTNKTATSDRHLEHRTPQWKVKVGSADWKLENSGETILSAIGLSFDQFCRMAMLAQGKFESFLTGDKKQREEVLEQLTDTKHFSDYGEAITQIFKDAKKDMELKHLLLGDESSKPLPADKVKEIETAKKEAEQEKQAVDASLGKTQSRRASVKAVLDNEKIVSEASAQKAQVEQQMKEEAYIVAKAFVEQWDKTDKERNALKSLLASQKGLADCSERAAKEAETFAILCSDIEARTIEKADLLSRMDDSAKALDEARKAVEVKQSEIDCLTKQRETLDPTSINSQINVIAQKKNELVKLDQSADALAEDQKLETVQQEKIRSEKSKLVPLQKALDEAVVAYDSAYVSFQDASTRYSTMNMSLEEQFVELRGKLKASDTCPLCGHKIDSVFSDADFRKILSPLDKEKHAAEKRMNEADVARADARTAVDALKAAVKTMEDALVTLQSKIKRQSSAIVKSAEVYRINPSVDIKQQIKALLAGLDDENKVLSDKQSQAEELQKKINDVLKAKKPLDAAFSAAQTLHGKIQTEATALEQLLDDLATRKDSLAKSHPQWSCGAGPAAKITCSNIRNEWNGFADRVSKLEQARTMHENAANEATMVLDAYYAASGKTTDDLQTLIAGESGVDSKRREVKNLDDQLLKYQTAIEQASKAISAVYAAADFKTREEMPELTVVEDEIATLTGKLEFVVGQIATSEEQLKSNQEKIAVYAQHQAEYDASVKVFDKWNLLNSYFGGTKFRTLVQSHILRPLLNNANIYLRKITDRYELTCSEDNEFLSILVMDNYMKQLRSSTVLSGGEKFMISLALSLALSSLNRPDMNVNILFIDEGFGTLDKDSLDSVMETLERLQEIAGQSNRRVGIISHREELEERIPVQVQVTKKGQGRSSVDVVYK